MLIDSDPNRFKIEDPSGRDGSTTLLEIILRAQGPFISGQDNMEPIYDNSGLKIGADFDTPMDNTTSMEDHEYGKKPRGRSVRDRLQRHVNTAVAIAGDNSNLADSIVKAITKAFGDIMLNFSVYSMLDREVIHRNQAKGMLKKVSVMI